jgi:hypothetical protein
MPQKLRIGFLFLDQLHHINHFVTIAIALAKKHDVKIITYPDKHAYLFKTLKRLNGDKVKVEMLKTQPFRAFTDTLKKRSQPRKGFWFKKNQKYLLSNFDALVFTDYIQKPLLKFRGENTRPKFIKLPHGMAGRAYGYKKDLLDFDLHLIFGSYYYEQLEKKNLLGNKTVVVGYPKLDALKTIETKTLFNNNKPIVFYNPHFTPEFSSWHQEGEAVLNYFKNQETYNLIFAPHINLFNKTGGESSSEFLETFKNDKHIFIDLGSEASVDMVYIKMASIYLGDVSSQSLEFMTTPRPCIFLNSHGVTYKNDNNYRFWKCGEVINKASELDDALNTANEKHKSTYLSVQKELNTGNHFTDSSSTPSERAALEIEEFLLS